MAYNPIWSEVCAMLSAQVAIAVVQAASGGMNNGQLAILEGSGKAESQASVGVDIDMGFSGLGLFHLVSDLNYIRTEFTADYDEPFGDLFDKASETAERYAQIAFDIDIYFSTKQEFIDEVIDSFEKAEKYVNTRIGVFI